MKLFLQCLRYAWFFLGSLLMYGIAHAQVDEPLVPLPEKIKLDNRKVALGAKLFVDVRFAKDNSMSCATCHRFDKGGSDGKPVATGIAGVKHNYNTPTIFNVALNFRQQWTGGADTLEDLVNKVVKSPKVFATSWPEVLGKLNKDVDLVREFKTVYPSGGLNAENAANALAEYQRSLVTPSRFDRYLRGEVSAITAEEKKGYDKFKAFGCIGCHQGQNVGGNMFQRFGAMNDFFADRAKAGKAITGPDKGRFNVTKNEEDMFIFKVPSLRNVALTAPYFHDGSAATLENAVDVMFRYQLGRQGSPEDKALIIKFLKSLTGELKEKQL